MCTSLHFSYLGLQVGFTRDFAAVVLLITNIHRQRSGFTVCLLFGMAVVFTCRPASSAAPGPLGAGRLTSWRRIKVLNRELEKSRGQDSTNPRDIVTTYEPPWKASAAVMALQLLRPCFCETSSRRLKTSKYFIKP